MSPTPPSPALPRTSHPAMPLGRPPSSARPGRGVQTVLGLAVLLPAVVALLWSYLLPSVTTFVQSFQRIDPLSRRPAESAGGETTRQLLDRGFAGNLGVVLLLSAVPLLLALLAAPLLAIAADRAGRVGRLVTRGLLVLPVAAYAPVAIAVAWNTDRLRIDSDAWNEHRSAPRCGTSLCSAPVWWSRSGPACSWPPCASDPVSAGTGSPSLPSAGWSGSASSRPRCRRTRSSGRGEPTSPARSPRSSSSDSNNSGWVPARPAVCCCWCCWRCSAWLRWGCWSSPAPGSSSTVGATGRSGAGHSATDPVRRVHPVAVVGLVVGLLAFLGVLGYVLLPWMRAYVDADPPAGQFSAGRIWVNTWLPPLVSALVAVGVAALGGFGIGALRPLGRRSELLLLPFAPWLFVGTGPLVVANYTRVRDFDQFNTFLGLIPPGWVSIRRWWRSPCCSGASGPGGTPVVGFVPTMLLPALPMLVGAGLVSWLVGAQELLWPQIVAQGIEHMPATGVVMLEFSRVFGTRHAAVSQVLPVPMLLLFLVAFVLLQLFYLDRLAIRAGSDEPRSRS